MDFKGELRVRFLNNVICLTFELIFRIYNFTLSTERKTQLIRKQILFTIVTSYFISDKMIHRKFYYYSSESLVFWFWKVRRTDRIIPECFSTFNYILISDRQFKPNLNTKIAPALIYSKFNEHLSAKRERDRELYISKKVIFIALKSLQNHIHLKRHWVIKNDFFTI